MSKSYLRGHEMVFTDGEWRYKDTMTPTGGNPRQCGYCHNADHKDGHDACLGELVGLMNACCGHGEKNKAYVQFYDSNCVYGVDATVIIEILKRQSTVNKLT